MATDKEVEDLRKQFVLLDKDGSGMILASELSQALQKQNFKMSTADINQLINEVDYQGNGKINYSEFLTATIDQAKFLDELKLRAVFNQFDTDRSGKITKENIHNAMQKLGMEVPLSDIEAIIKTHDLTKDGMISFDEFKKIFDTNTNKPFGADGPKTT